MEGDVSTDHFQDTNAAATTSGKGSISTVALAESTTGATTTTTARGKRSSAIVGFGATLNSLLLGGSPSPPPSSINAYQLQGQEGEGRWGTLVLCVRDEGAGISKDHQAMLFQEFVQFNATKLQAGGGSGLGKSSPNGHTLHIYSVRMHLFNANVSSHHTDISFPYPSFAVSLILRSVHLQTSGRAPWRYDRGVQCWGRTRLLVYCRTTHVSEADSIFFASKPVPSQHQSSCQTSNAFGHSCRYRR